MIDIARVNELRDEIGADELFEFVELFCEEAEETLTRIRATDAAVAAEELHFLRGSVLNIGMSEVGRICQEAEREAQDGRVSRMAVQNISKAFSAAKTRLLIEIARPDAPTATSSGL